MVIERITAKDWPHAPVHRCSSDGIYMVTASTLYKQHLFTSHENLTFLESSLLSLAKSYEWQLEAWAVFSNHYHFVGRSNTQAANLGTFLKHLHADTARDLNRQNNQIGRTVWFNFWDFIKTR